MQEDYTPDIITLSDENGEEFSLEVLDAIDFEDSHYLALVPVSDGENTIEDDGTVVILKEVVDGDEFYYEEIENDEEYEEVSEIFTERLEEFFEVDRK